MILAFYDKTAGQIFFADMKDLQGEYGAEFQLPKDMDGSRYGVSALDQDTLIPPRAVRRSATL